MATYRNAFPYPGGKSTLAHWLIDHLPPHHAFVDVFHGGGSVLVQKPESKIEVVNDKDSDIVQFLRVLRERPDDLREWFESITVARDTHRRFANQFYAGYRPDDPVERAGRFGYLRHTQFAVKYTSVSGVRARGDRNTASRVRDWSDSLEELAERYRHVQVENRDWRDVINRYDGGDVCFYADPPYPDASRCMYRVGDEFDHEALADQLAEIDGDWLVSYERVPEAVERAAEAVVSRTHGHTEADDHERVERLALSFDPETTPSWVDTVGGTGRQSRLASPGAGVDTDADTNW